MSESIELTISCFDWTGVLINLQTEVASIVSVSQALQYVLDNKEGYLSQYPCAQCLTRIESFQRMLVEAVQRCEEQRQVEKLQTAKNEIIH